MKTLFHNDPCEFAIGSLRCIHMAKHIIHRRDTGEVLKVCREHVDLIEQENKAEYHAHCPNCSCYHGVN